MLIAAGEARNFWDQVSASDPRLLANGGHPVLQEPNYKDRFVPLWLHGDGVAYSENDSLMVFSTGSVLTMSTTMLTMLYMASFIKSVTATQTAHGADTWATIWRRLVWSFVALWFGIHPDRDWDDQPFALGSRFAAAAGTPLAGGFRFLIWNIIGDLEFMANVLGLPHWRNPLICSECDCTQAEGDRPYTKHFAGKLWSLFDAAIYSFVSRKNHPLFVLPGVSAWSCCQDTLHCLDTKGVGSHMCGSCLHQMVYERVAGRGAHAELARLWQQILVIYDQLQSKERLTHLQLSMLCNVDKPHAEYPSLHCKGAECRHLVPVLAVLAQQNCNGSVVSKTRVAALQALAEFHKICNSQPMFMQQAAYDEAMTTMETFLVHYTYLHHLAAAQNRKYYNIIPKVHFCWHLAYNCRFMNARFKWTYKAESWVGKVSDITASCASGTRLTKLTVPLAEKYLCYVSVRLDRCQD